MDARNDDGDLLPRKGVGETNAQTEVAKLKKTARDRDRMASDNELHMVLDDGEMHVEIYGNYSNSEETETNQYRQRDEYMKWTMELSADVR